MTDVARLAAGGGGRGRGGGGGGPVERTDHRRDLVSEIVLDNPAATPASVERLVVLDQRRRRLAAYDAAAIAGMAFPYESVLAPGARAVLRLDVALPAGGARPRR